MKPTGQTVPLRGNREYKDAFAILARKKQQPMSELVRDALDKVYGKEIERELSFFASSDDYNNHQGESGAEHA